MLSRTDGGRWWLVVVAACAWPIHAQDSVSQRPPSAATRELRAYEAAVTRRIIPVSRRVFVAVGHTLSSNGLIVGDDGVIIVDPGHAEPFSWNVREGLAEGSISMTTRHYSASYANHLRAEAAGGR